MNTHNTVSASFGAVAKNASHRCPYCGKKLKTTSVKVLGKTYADLPCFATCGCEKSKEAMSGKVLTDAERAQAKYERAGIGKHYFTAIATPDNVQAVKAGKSLFIYGEIGAGKTYLASATAMRLIDMGYSVKFDTMVSILRQLRESFDGAPTRVLEQALSYDVLVLDDLGKEYPTDFALSTLYEIINLRYANSMPMIVTSNYQGDELIQHMSKANSSTAKAIVSRLVEMCMFIHLDQIDRRTA